MVIQQKDGISTGSFFIEEEGKTIAEYTYSKAGSDKIIIDHTEVFGEIRGQHIGNELVEHTVNYARENELTVIPLCPFAKSVIERDESLQDVLNSYDHLTINNICHHETEYIHKSKGSFVARTACSRRVARDT